VRAACTVALVLDLTGGAADTLPRSEDWPLFVEEDVAEAGIVVTGGARTAEAIGVSAGKKGRGGQAVGELIEARCTGLRVAHARNVARPSRVLVVRPRPHGSRVRTRLPRQ